MEKIDNLDRKILGILSKNARIPFKDVAAECGVSRAAIHQRVQHLMEDGFITGSGFDVNPKSLGYSTCTYVGLNLERGNMYKKVVERCAMIRDFGDKTQNVLEIWSRIKGDNLGVGITILIFAVVAFMSGWTIYKRWLKYKRNKMQRRRNRRKTFRTFRKP